MAVKNETIFTDEFPIVKSDKELNKIKKKFKNYDPYYVASGCIVGRKEKFDNLWKKFRLYSDSHFLSEVKKHFHQRTWEMYVACIFIENGFKIESSNKGPDIKIALGKKTIWIECVACDVGVGPNRVPPLSYNGEFHDYPEKQLILRITSSLNEKYKKYLKYLKEGIVKEDDIFIIAINRAGLDHCDPGMPLIFKAVFGIEFLNFPISILRESKTKKKPFWSIRNKIFKQNGQEISVKFFEKSEHSGISAIIYSKDNILNHPRKIGSECMVTHNKIAKNILNKDTFSFFDQYKDTGNQIVKL